MVISDPNAEEVLAAVPATLRALRAQNTALLTKLASYERQKQAEEIVTSMERRGLGDSSVPLNKRVSDLLSSQKDLDVVKEAVALATPDMSFASISYRPDVDNRTSLDSYLLEGDGY